MRNTCLIFIFLILISGTSAFNVPIRRWHNLNSRRDENIGGGGGKNGQNKRFMFGDSDDGFRNKIISGSFFSMAFAEKAKNQAKRSLAVLKIPGFNAKLPFLWYLDLLEKRPLLTKSITSGIIAITGDWAAQAVSQKLKSRDLQKVAKISGFNLGTLFTINGQYNMRRGLACMIDGLCISGPIMHLAYDLFERTFPVSQGGSVAAICHVIADSLVLDSIFIATAMVITGVLEGYSFQTDILPQFRTDYLPAIRASWITSTSLIPIEFACFRYLPLSLRTLSMNFTSVIWDGVVYFMAHRSR